MALNHFTFNGHSTGELGLLVSGINIYGAPSRIVEKVNIPYRSGDLLIDTGAYSNYMLTYTVDIIDSTKATAEAINDWLLNTVGYCELSDTYNTDYYRMAAYYNQLDYTLSALYRYGRATITFDCKPQKYLNSGKSPLSRTSGQKVTNPTNIPSKPFMRIYGTGTVALGTQSFTINTNTNFIDIDCDTMQIYRGTTNLAGDVTMTEFPTLQPGDTTITLANTITSFSITPRWWKL